MLSCALDSFFLSFGFRVGMLQVGKEVFFSSVFGVESGHWTFHASFIGGGQGGGKGGFIFLSANRRAQSALLLFLLS